MIKVALKWLSDWRIHIWIWCSYIFYENVVIGLLFDVYAHPLIYILHYSIIVAFFYAHALYLLPNVLGNSRNAIFKVPLIVILQIPLYILLHYLANCILAGVHLLQASEVKLDREFILRNCYRGFYFMAISTGYYYLKNYLHERKVIEALERESLHNIIRSQKIEQELMAAKNAYLKAQINPHFLFNTLDFVYHNVNMHSTVAGDAIIRLSEMMRFAIDSDGAGGKIPLMAELEQVENLIFLNQIRKNHLLQINFSYSPEVSRLRIIPLLLLTLTENIFKHGDLNDISSPASISVSIEQHYLKITTQNKPTYGEIRENHGLGIINLRTRLAQVYGDEAKLLCEQHETFKVLLEIPVRLLT